MKLNKNNIIFMYLILFSLSLFMVAGCEKPGDINSNSKVENLTPVEIVNNFLISLDNLSIDTYESSFDYIDKNNKDYKKVKNAIDARITTNGKFSRNEDNDVTKQIIKSISTNFKFDNLKEISNDGKLATVSVTITGIDYGEIYFQILQEFADYVDEMKTKKEPLIEEELVKMQDLKVLERFSEEEPKLITKEIVFTLKKDYKGEFKIVPDNRLLSAYIPNVERFVEFFNQYK